MPGASSSRPQGGGGGGGPPPQQQHVPAGFDPSTGTYAQPMVYQQVREKERREKSFEIGSV